MNTIASDTPIVPETDCAICHEPVDTRYWHMKFAYHLFDGSFGVRIGVMHSGCVPAEGIDTWCETQCGIRRSR